MHAVIVRPQTVAEHKTVPVYEVDIYLYKCQATVIDFTFFSFSPDGLSI